MGSEWKPIDYENPYPVCPEKHISIGLLEQLELQHAAYEQAWTDAMQAVAKEFDQMVLNLKGNNNLVDEGILYAYLARYFRGSR